jgi:hypothetical protein
MRPLLVIVSLLLLGACNMVVTKAPLFAKSDTIGAPQLRPGVWIEQSDKPCDFDPSKPLADWPACAKGSVVLDGKIGGYNVDANGKKAWTTSELLVAGGNPRVIQVRMEDLDVKGVGDIPIGPMYFYMAAHPTKTDEAGRVIAYTAWPVLCGPPPPADAKTPSGGMRSGTLEPLPGLTMDKDDNNCTTTSQDAVRAAAAASEKWTPPSTLSAVRWVRDGDR